MGWDGRKIDPHANRVLQYSVPTGTYCILQILLVRVAARRVPQNLLQQQRVLDQTAARNIQETPEVQLPAEGRLQAALKEILHSLVLLLLIQERFCCQLITAVFFVFIEPWQLDKKEQML